MRIPIHNRPEYFEFLEQNLQHADIVIGVSFSERPVNKECIQALDNLIHPPNTRVVITATQDFEYDESNIAKSRNIIVNRAINACAKYLFFIDADVQVPLEALLKLHVVLKKNPQAAICAGIYNKKDEKRRRIPVVWDENMNTISDWEENEIFQCGAIGAGCMLINLSILSNVSLPWFNSIKDDDIYFCKKVRNELYQVLAHGGVLCRHLHGNTVY